MNRRKFIQRSAMTSAGLGMANVFPFHTLKSKNPPSDSLNVALIGCRNMGFGILQHHLSNPGVTCMALICEQIKFLLMTNKI